VIHPVKREACPRWEATAGSVSTGIRGLESAKPDDCRSCPSSTACSTRRVACPRSRERRP